MESGIKASTPMENLQSAQTRSNASGAVTASHVTTTDPPAVVTTTDTHAAVTADPPAATANPPVVVATTDPPAVVTTTNPHAAVTTSALVSSTTELHVDPTSATAHLATESTTPYPLPNTALPIASEPTDLLLRTVDVPLSSEKTLDSLTQADGNVLDSISSVSPSDPNMCNNKSSLVVTNVLPSASTVLPPPKETQTSISEVNVSPIISPDSLPQTSEKCVPSLGSWAKPLLFKSPATPPEPCTPKDYDPAVVGNQLAALWPTLNDGILNKQPKTSTTRTKTDGSLCFPWAARLSPQSRNLYRAATPTYRLDGTPEVSIPSKVLRLGPENKDEYIIGKFHKCSLPPGGLIHAVVNRIWGRNCKINSDDSEIHTTAKKGLQSEADIMQPLHSSDIVLDHHVTDTTTASLPSSPLTQQVTHTASLNFFKTLPTLIDSSSTPITTLIMESSPSTFINTEVQGTYVVDPLTITPMSCVFESPSRYTLLGDGDEAETGASCSLSLTRGTREIKPPAKYQDMDWKTVRGRGKRGRRGRGSHH
ncbi:hypothetical protein IGI04_002117 [Brassica rapa subsp. trilocularis]|uniref:DUF4283 domain-containing protein n=1 Tax=Brassica rapa subsp. trilocularis TaxID=1813537 RepID=A0ABQ7NWU2_BRACM|nr:hypothetical protein IGI04_002117 [Brassica rapa subsp. trilocularis]